MLNTAAKRSLVPLAAITLVVAFAWIAPGVRMPNFSLTGCGGYGYPASAPQVTGVSPRVGPLAGGTVVTITGCTFSGTTAVKFGGTAVSPSNMAVNSDTQITAISPAHAAGTVDVTVTNAGGTSPVAAADQFTYNTPCTSVTLTAAPPTSTSSGTSVTFTAVAATCASAQYAFWIKSPGATLSTLVANYSATNTFTWSTGSNVAGTYQITVWAKDASSPGAFSNFYGIWDTYNFIQYTLTTPCPTTNDAAAPPNAAMKATGQSVTFTATAPGCTTPNFEFWIKSPGASLYTMVQAYSATNTFTWQTASNGPGTYAVTVWGKESGTSGTSCNSSGCWDSYNYMQYTITAGCPSVADVAVPASPQAHGTSIMFTASAPGCPNPHYQFWILSPGATSYTLVQAYSTTNTFTWATGSDGAGTYAVTVWVRDASSAGTSSNASGTWDAYNYQQFKLT